MDVPVPLTRLSLGAVLALVAGCSAPMPAASSLAPLDRIAPSGRELTSTRAPVRDAHAPVTTSEMVRGLTRERTPGPRLDPNILGAVPASGLDPGGAVRGDRTGPPALTSGVAQAGPAASPEAAAPDSDAAPFAGPVPVLSMEDALTENAPARSRAERARIEYGIQHDILEKKPARDLDAQLTRVASAGQSVEWTPPALPPTQSFIGAGFRSWMRDPPRLPLHVRMCISNCLPGRSSIPRYAYRRR